MSPTVDPDVKGQGGKALKSPIMQPALTANFQKAGCITKGGPEGAKAGNKVLKQESLFRLNASLKKMVQTTNSTSKQRCNNDACYNQSENLVLAPPHALVYFGVSPSSGKGHWKICAACLKEADDYHECSKRAVKEKKNMFSLAFKVQPAVVELDDDDEGVGKENVQKDGATAALPSREGVDGLNDGEDVYSVSTSGKHVLENEIEKLMKAVRIKDQVLKCKATVEAEIDALSTDLTSMDITLDATFTQLSQALGDFNRIFKTDENVLVGSAEETEDGSFVSKECEQLENRLRLHGIKKEPKDVKEFRNCVQGKEVNVKTEDMKFNTNENRSLPSKPFPFMDKLVFVPPKVSQRVYGMNLDLLTCWQPATIVRISEGGNGEQVYVVEFYPSNIVKNLLGSQIAFMKPIVGLALPVGSRIIARFNDVLRSNPETHGKLFAGIVGERPGPSNKKRYLIFFDDGYSQYVSPEHVIPVVESSKKGYVSELVHEDMRPFIQKYLSTYPERNLLKASVGDLLKVELYGSWLPVRVEEVDCALMKIFYTKTKDSYEWIYRGSTRLEPLFKGIPIKQVKGSVVTNGVKRDEDLVKLEKPQAKKIQVAPIVGWKMAELMNYETAGNMTKIVIPPETPTPRKLVQHYCSVECAYKYEESRFRTVSPLVIPFYLGWARELCSPTSRIVAYISPCGIRLNSYDLIHCYIRRTRCDIPIDYFSLEASIDCLNQFRATRELQLLKDISYGKEWTPVQCVNSIDRDLPASLEYSSTSIFGSGVKKIDDEDFLVCCDCTDGCKDKEKCACWQLTLSGTSFKASGTGKNMEIKTTSKGYENRRLPEWVASGIYECNKKCRCNVRTCANRVAQNKVKWPVQIFKTIKKGWGVRALHDIPKGSFICTYTGRVMNCDETDEEGRIFGDEYIADLDYIEVMESSKEGYEAYCNDMSEDEAEIESFTSVFKERTSLLTTDQSRVENKMAPVQIARKSTGGAKRKERRTVSNSVNPSVPRFVSTSSKFNGQGKALGFRKYFGMVGEDERPYSIDGKRFGNFGRYFNHSCDPNLFIQTIFMESHDLRFPSVAFFTNKDVKAGTELCWDYKYEVGSVVSKSLFCYCDSSNCRKRLL